MEGERNGMVETREEFLNRALAEYESPLIGYALGFLHDADKARDVVQDTFIRLYQQDMAKVSAGLKTWLFTVCRNRALDILRKEKRLVALKEEKMERISADIADPLEEADWEERGRQLRRALDRLNDNQREVIRLKFEQNLSYKEISEITGLSTGNVGFLLHVGLKKLRGFLPDDLLSNEHPRTYQS
ncbi:MAG: RNA polymerase sigma factor [Verrucomicrobiales bacterium]